VESLPPTPRLGYGRLLALSLGVMSVLEYGNSSTTNAPADAAAPETKVMSSVTPEISPIIATEGAIEIGDSPAPRTATVTDSADPGSTPMDPATRLQTLLCLGSEIVAYSERTTDPPPSRFHDELNGFLRREHVSL